MHCRNSSLLLFLRPFNAVRRRTYVVDLSTGPCFRQTHGLDELAIECVGEGLKIHTVSFVICHEESASLVVSPMTPTVPLPNRVCSREALQLGCPLDPHPAFDGFESAAISQLPADTAEIDMGLIERQAGKVGNKHREIEGCPTKGDQEFVLAEFLGQSPPVERFTPDSAV